jgi:hypothetical protein
MIARVTLKRGLAALWCLVVAAGCARVADEVADDAGIPAAPATVTVPAVATAPSAAVDLPAPAAPAALDSLAEGKQGSNDAPFIARGAQLPSPSVSDTESPSSRSEAPVSETAAPERRDFERRPELIEPAVASPLAVDTLDVTSLLARLRKTKAINLRTKLAVKKESDDLMERFRDYHARHGAATLPELRRSYDSLFLRLYSLLEDRDPSLARDIDRSRAAIWAILADPMKFGSSVPIVPTRAVPPA